MQLRYPDHPGRNRLGSVVQLAFIKANLGTRNFTQLQLHSHYILQTRQSIAVAVTSLGHGRILGEGRALELVIGQKPDTVGQEYDADIIILKFVFVEGRHVIDAGQHRAEAPGVGEVRMVDHLDHLFIIRLGCRGEQGQTDQHCRNRQQEFFKNQTTHGSSFIKCMLVITAYNSMKGMKLSRRMPGHSVTPRRRSVRRAARHPARRLRAASKKCSTPHVAGWHDSARDRWPSIPAANRGRPGCRRTRPEDTGIAGE